MAAPRSVLGIALLGLALAAAGCGGASGAPETEAEAPEREAKERAKASEKVCEELAVSFFTVAEDRDDGMTRDEQVKRARQTVDRRKGDAAFAHWLRIIDLVYRSPDDSPKEIAVKVLDSCEVNDQGQAVVRATWPTGVRRRP